MQRLLRASLIWNVSAVASAWVVGLSSLVAVFYLIDHEEWNLIVALMTAATLLVVAVRDRPLSLLLTLGYLNMMGDFRRASAGLTGLPAFDALLLVGPVVATVMATPLLLMVKVRDHLSKAILYLTVIMIVQIFNPTQGGLSVGFVGAMFYLVPVLWFWIGRRYASPRIVGRMLNGVVFPLAVADGLLGLYQSYFGFLPFEKSWIEVAKKTYLALNLGNGEVRAFGFSVSAAEYATLLGIALVGICAASFARRSGWLLALPILVLATFLESSRGEVFRVIITLATAWTLRKGKRVTPYTFVRLAFFLMLGLGATVVTAAQLHSDVHSRGASPVENAIAHQTGGLGHPLDKTYSTAGVHSELVFDGIVEGVLNPLGRGLGGTTGAFLKFHVNAKGGSSEVDFSDEFISLGLFGGIVYAFVIVTAIRSAVAYTRRAPISVGLPTMAIIIITIGYWLIGGQYSTAAMSFFFIGATVHKDLKAD